MSICNHAAAIASHACMQTSCCWAGDGARDACALVTKKPGERHLSMQPALPKLAATHHHTALSSSTNAAPRQHQGSAALRTGRAVQNWGCQPDHALPLTCHPTMLVTTVHACSDCTLHPTPACLPVEVSSHGGGAAPATSRHHSKLGRGGWNPAVQSSYHTQQATEHLSKSALSPSLLASTLRDVAPARR